MGQQAHGLNDTGPVLFQCAWALGRQRAKEFGDTRDKRSQTPGWSDQPRVCLMTQRKLRASATVQRPRAMRTRGFSQPKLPSKQLVLAGTPGARLWMRIRFHRSRK